MTDVPFDPAASPDRDEVRVAVARLRAGVAAVFSAVGCPPAEATAIADGLVGANLTGHDSHGVVRVPTYLEWLAAGHVHPGRTVRTVLDGGGFVVLDGDRGFGQTVAAQATEIGVTRAQAQGSCVVALRDSGHIGRVGEYAETALAAGLLSVHFVNVAGSPLVAPFGGVDRRFSTAPVAIGVPLPGRPVVLDFATSLVAEGKVQVASWGGKPLPSDALITADGAPSGNPRVLFGDYGPTQVRKAADGTGALRAFGGHKGSGLALACELLAGAFTGGGCAGPVEPGAGPRNGVLSVYLSPDHFGTRAELERIGGDYVEWVTGSRPETPGGRVLLPGDIEATTRQDRLATGVPLPVGTWTALQRVAAERGVRFGD